MIYKKKKIINNNEKKKDKHGTDTRVLVLLLAVKASARGQQHPNWRQTSTTSFCTFINIKSKLLILHEKNTLTTILNKLSAK